MKILLYNVNAALSKKAAFAFLDISDFKFQIYISG